MLKLMTRVSGYCSMDAMQSSAQRNAMLVHGLDWSERRAGIFEPAPSDEAAVATTLGLVLNCLSSGLYMVHHCHFLRSLVLWCKIVLHAGSLYCPCAQLPSLRALYPTALQCTPLLCSTVKLHRTLLLQTVCQACPAGSEVTSFF